MATTNRRDYPENALDEKGRQMNKANVYLSLMDAIVERELTKRAKGDEDEEDAYNKKWPRRGELGVRCAIRR